MTIALTYLNLLVALTSALFGFFALFRPTLINPGADGSAGEAFFARMYAARAVPFGLIAGFVPLFFGGWPVAVLLFAAALTQLADVVIGRFHRLTGMTVGALIAVLVHGSLGLMLI